MENLYILLNKRFQYLKNFITLSDEFFKNISEIARGFDIDIFNKFYKLIEILNKYTEEINPYLLPNAANTTNIPDIISKTIKIYDLLTLSEHEIPFILN